MIQYKLEKYSLHPPNWQHKQCLFQIHQPQLEASQGRVSQPCKLSWWKSIYLVDILHAWFLHNQTQQAQNLRLSNYPHMLPVRKPIVLRCPRSWKGTGIVGAWTNKHQFLKPLTLQESSEGLIKPGWGGGQVEEGARKFIVDVHCRHHGLFGKKT